MPQRSPPMGAVGSGLSLKDHVLAFLDSLDGLRYAKKTREDKRRTLERFLRWMRDTGVTLGDINEPLVATFMEGLSVRLRKRGRSELATLQQFLVQLRAAGVVPSACEPERSPTDVLVGRYREYLRHSRGLSARSVAVYVPFIREFAVAHGLGNQVPLDTCLDAGVVRGHLVDRARGRSSEYTRLLATSLRSFLRFLFVHAEICVDLSTAVPPVRRWQLAGVPEFLSADQVEQVLAAIDRTTSQGCRAYAILLLLARLGLRPGEVAGLELDDIHWAAGEIVVPGKGRFHAHLPLVEDVGEALVLYLRNARGSSPSRRAFLRLQAPHVGLTGPSAICIVARGALRRAGLSLRGRVGAHVFRHSLATRMLRHGASLSEISQVLRHRSAVTTQIYAKVDFEALRGVARPWPVATGGGQ